MRFQSVHAAFVLALVAFGGWACDGFKPASQVSDSSGAKPGSGAVTRTTHAAHFPIATGAHANADCNSCHGGLNSFKEFSCVGCHDHAQPATDARHVAITDYKYDSKACIGCHPQGMGGTISRADHTKFFPIDVKTPHANGQCTDCHSNPADRKVFTCVSCHDHAQPVTDMHHGGVVGYQYESAACLKCHAQGKASFDHATLGAMPNCIGCHQNKLALAAITPASNHTTNGFPAACESCHKSFAAWGPGTPMQHAVVGNTAAKCQTCHLANFNAAVSPFNHVGQQVLPDTCNGCHTDFTTWTKFDHNPSSCYNGATRKSHEKATCAQCHPTAGNYKQSSCTACHRDRGTNCDD